MSLRSFASDNNSGIHPEILKAIEKANIGHTVAYGGDPYTPKAIAKFREIFGSQIDVFFVFGGTGANAISLKACTESFHAIICAETAHINENECGAPEKFTGCKLLTIPTKNGKLTVKEIEKHLIIFDNEHHSQPKVISITQSTELGTIYQPEEIRAIANLAHEHNMFLHMDGARIANAVAALNVNIQEITNEAGVDILSFGGTKNGLLFGEAVVVFNKKLTPNIKFFRKQGMQLPSKMRFIAAQFERLLTNNFWLKNAENANKTAKILAHQLSKIPQIKILQKVESNIIFATLPKEIIPKIQKKYFFYEESAGARFVTSFDTTEEDIENFVALVKKNVRT